MTLPSPGVSAAPTVVVPVTTAVLGGLVVLSAVVVAVVVCGAEEVPWFASDVDVLETTLSFVSTLPSVVGRGMSLRIGLSFSSAGVVGVAAASFDGRGMSSG